MIREKGALGAAYPEGELEIASGEVYEPILPQDGWFCKGPDPLITVIDQRVDDRFTVHRRAIDQWVAVVGLEGIGLYALYCHAAVSGSVAGDQVTGERIAQLRRLLLWAGLIHTAADGAILLPDPPERSKQRLEELGELLRIAVATDISPTWMRALTRVRALCRGTGLAEGMK